MAMKIFLTGVILMVFCSIGIHSDPSPLDAFTLPDTNYRNETEMKALLAAMQKASFRQDKLKVLEDDIAKYKTKYFSAVQTAEVLQQLTFSQDLESAVKMMSEHIIQLTCKDVASILKKFSFSSDQLKALAILKDLITDAKSDANKKVVIDVFAFTSDKEAAAKLLASIIPKANPLYGRVVYNPVIFVIDVSGSMDTPFKTSNGQTRTRLNVAVEELINVINEQLSPEKSVFNVILFSDSPSAFFPEPVLATPQNKQDAIKRLRGVRSGGGTNTLHALTRAFATKNLDGVYLLSDGEPTDAKADAIIAAATGNLQLGRKVPITTIGFFLPQKNPNARAFMEKLAIATGGLFRAIE